MKKYYFLIIVALILGLVLSGCLLSNVGQVPTSEQSGVTYLTKSGSPPGLVGLWHLDEGAGIAASDSSGNGNDGTITGATYAGSANAKFGDALNFDGVDDYVEVPDSTSLDITGDLTIEAWVKFDNFTNPHSFIVGKDTVSERSYGLFVDGGHYAKTGKVGFIVFSASSYTIHWGDTALNTGQWYHIAGTYDYVANGTSVMEVYINGNSDSTTTTNAVGPIYSGKANLQIGARQYPPGYWRCFVDGTIDEVRIWNTALSADQLIIYDDFNGLLAPYKEPPKAFKVGRSIPLKWQYTDLFGTAVDSSAANPSVEIKWASNGDTLVEGDLIEVEDPGSSGYHYDGGTDTWQFNWQTKGCPAGTYNIWIINNWTGQTFGPFPIQLR